MADPGAPSGVIAQLTTTSGLDAYTLGMPIRDKLPISAAYADGVTIRYRVTDDSGTQEISEGIFIAPNMITRDTLVLSSTGSFIDWPISGQRIITPIIDLPICDTLPIIGQLLAWNGMEWCPITRTVSSNVAVVCPTPPLDGQVLIWSALENAYCPADFCTLVAACINPTFSCNAVFFDGTTFLWGFPAMTDSPTGSMSVWLYMSSSQEIDSGTFGAPWTTIGGDLFYKDTENTAIITDQSGNLSQYISVGLGSGINGPSLPPPGPHPMFAPSSGGNTLTNISATNPTVWTFANPHRVLVDSVFTQIAVVLGTNDPQYASPTLFHQYIQVSAVTTNTITLNYDASAATGAFSPVTEYSYNVLNSLTLWLSNNGSSNWLQWATETKMPQGQWVNLLMSWDANHAAGGKVVDIYYGDTQVLPSAVWDYTASFDIYYSDPSGGEGLSWSVGFGDNRNILCYMAEMWFAPGQRIDFTDSANRAKFHDLTTGVPISLGSDGSLPTGTPPVLYQRVPGSGVATDFLINRAGGTPLIRNTGSDSFDLAPTSPCA